MFQQAPMSFALALASMVVYAAIGRKQDKDARDKGTQFLMGLGNFLVHWFMWAIGPIEMRLAPAVAMSRTVVVGPRLALTGAPSSVATTTPASR